jgi:hypothetical protein
MPALRPACGFGGWFLVWLCFALRGHDLWRVCAIAPSFVSGWRAFSSVSLCTYFFDCTIRHVSFSHPFVPLSVESFGHLQAPALSLLRSLADHTVQAWGPSLSWDAFVSGALREHGVALCCGNASLGRSGLYNLTEGVWPGPVTRPLLSLGRGGLRLSAVTCLAVALADMCGCVWSLSRVGVSLVARVCLCLASPLVCFALGSASASFTFRPPCC